MSGGAFLALVIDTPSARLTCREVAERVFGTCPLIHQRSFARRWV